MEAIMENTTTLPEQSDGLLQGDSKQFLTFTVMDEEYGVNIMDVVEIKGWTKATRVPNAPKYVVGVINLRGSIIPIFDLRARFSGKMTETKPSHVFIIMAIEDRNVGVLVDTVSDILTVQESEVKPSPQLDSEKDANFIDGLISRENRMIVILKSKYLFNDQDLDASAALAAENVNEIN